jgi:hypothetical protein
MIGPAAVLLALSTPGPFLAVDLQRTTISWLCDHQEERLLPLGVTPILQVLVRDGPICKSLAQPIIWASLGCPRHPNSPNCCGVGTQPAADIMHKHHHEEGAKVDQAACPAWCEGCFFNSGWRQYPTPWMPLCMMNSSQDPASSCQRSFTSPTGKGLNTKGSTSSPEHRYVPRWDYNGM